jgi:hypothetical protein
VNCTTAGGAALEPVDFSVKSMQIASTFRVQRADGTAYRVNPDVTATLIPPFA